MTACIRQSCKLQNVLQLKQKGIHPLIHLQAHLWKRLPENRQLRGDSRRVVHAGSPLSPALPPCPAALPLAGPAGLPF